MCQQVQFIDPMFFPCWKLIQHGTNIRLSRVFAGCCVEKARLTCRQYQHHIWSQVLLPSDIAHVVCLVNQPILQGVCHQISAEFWALRSASTFGIRITREIVRMTRILFKQTRNKQTSLKTNWFHNCIMYASKTLACLLSPSWCNNENQ